MKAPFRFALILGSFVVLTPQALAHVTLNPREIMPGYTVLEVRVPAERPVPTTEVRLVVPEGSDLLGIQPVAGWTAVTTTAPAAPEAAQGEEPAARITEVRWTGGKIQPKEFQSFRISTRTTSPGTFTWKAYQTYEGGEVVAWDGASEKLPAPTVTVLAQTEVNEARAEIDAVRTAVNRTLWLAGIAFLFALAALLMARRAR